MYDAAPCDLSAKAQLISGKFYKIAAIKASLFFKSSRTIPAT